MYMSKSVQTSLCTLSKLNHGLEFREYDFSNMNKLIILYFDMLQNLNLQPMLNHNSSVG